jgi:predicted nucleic acid-binding protein
MTLISSFGKPPLDDKVAPFKIPEIAHALQEVLMDGQRSRATDPPDLSWFVRLLRGRRERPRRRTAAEQRDEVAASHAEHEDFLPLSSGVVATGRAARFTACSACRRAAGRSLGQT